MSMHRDEEVKNTIDEFFAKLFYHILADDNRKILMKRVWAMVRLSVQKKTAEQRARSYAVMYQQNHGLGEHFPLDSYVYREENKFVNVIEAAAAEAREMAAAKIPPGNEANTAAEN